MSQTTYRDRFSVAIAGMIEGTGNIQAEAYLNDGGYAAEVWTITTPATPADNTLYTIDLIDARHPLGNIPSDTIGFTTGVGTTRAQLAQGLYDAARANLVFNGLVLIANNTSTLVLTHRKPNTPFTPIVGGGGAAPLTVPGSPTTAAAAPGVISFGVGVVRINTKSARLPNSGDSINAIAGFTMNTSQIQKIGIGEAAIVGYAPSTLPMNVLQRCGTNPGIWVRTNETSINPDSDSVYLSVATDSKGYVQKTNANSAIDISTKARFRSGIETTVNGNRVVKIQYDL